RLWDPTTATHLHTLTGHTGPVYSCAFSPDGTTLATTSEGGTIRLWDPTTATHLHTLTGHTGPVYSCAFSPDGTTLATTSWDGTIRLWDPTTATHLHTLTGHTGPVYSCAFSPDGTTLATTSEGGTIRLWDPTTATHLHTLTGHTGPVYSCAFSPDGTTLATTSWDGTVRLWDPTTATHLHTLTGHTGPVYSCAFSPDGTTFATTSQYDVRLWDPTTATHLHTLTGHTNWVVGCAFSPDGTTLATTSRDNTIRLWDPTAATTHLNSLTGHTSAVYSCAFSPDGTTLATTSQDGTVRLWDPTTGQHLHTLTGHTSPLYSCAFSPDGTTLATTSQDGTVRLWDPTTGQHLHTLTGHTSPLYSCAFSPDGTTLATTSQDGTVRLWDPTTGQHLHTLTGHTSPVTACAFAPDGTTLATTSQDGTIRLWDTHHDTLTTHTSPVTSCAFSPDGTTLAATGQDGTIRLWDPTTGPALRGSPITLVLVGPPSAACMIAGSASALRSARLSGPALASGGGVIAAALFAAGVPVRSVGEMTARIVTRRRWTRRNRVDDPAGSLAAMLRALAVSTTGDLRVPVPHQLFRHRLQVTLVDTATNQTVVLPLDANRLGLDPDSLSIEALARASLSGPADPAVDLGGRQFRAAFDRPLDLGPSLANPPPGRRTTILVDVATSDGDAPPAALPSDDHTVRVTLPHPSIPDMTVTLGARHAAVLTELGCEHASRVIVKARSSGALRPRVRLPQPKAALPLRVFISHRRDDRPAEAQALARALRTAVGMSNVFFDVDTIPAGANFRSAIETALNAADVAVVVIGERWTERLAEPDDLVRLELEHAFNRGLTIVPVLVGRQPLAPQELPGALALLARISAVRLDPSAVDDGIRQVVERLHNQPGQRAASPQSFR
ncbi:MAG: TIR domain-containing protein, partial [Acidimicrobiia bacterium]